MHSTHARKLTSRWNAKKDQFTKLQASINVQQEHGQGHQQRSNPVGIDCN
jgi:hypothetical protein